MGMTFPTLAQYEQGRRIPYPQSLERLADFYEITVDEILGREIQVSEDCVKVFLRHKGLAEEDVALVMEIVKAVLRTRGKL